MIEQDDARRKDETSTLLVVGRSFARQECWCQKMNRIFFYTSTQKTVAMVRIDVNVTTETIILLRSFGRVCANAENKKDTC